MGNHDSHSDRESNDSDSEFLSFFMAYSNAPLYKNPFLLSIYIPLHGVPCFKDQAPCAVFAVFPLFFFFEDAEGFAREVRIVNIIVKYEPVPN